MQAGQGVAGIDPHKRSLTVAVLTGIGGLVATRSFPVSQAGLTALLAWLAGHGLSLVRIGVEGASGLGRPVVAALRQSGYDVREVPPGRTAERRRRRSRAKSDAVDAVAIARETLADPGLPPAGKHADDVPAAWNELQVLYRWRSSNARARRRLVNEAEGVLTALPIAVRDRLPNTRKVLVALAALRALTGDPTDGSPLALAGQLSGAERLQVQWALSLADQITEIDRRMTDITRAAKPLLKQLGSTLTDITGIGVVSAMTLLCEVGDPNRFASDSQFARWCGIAPLPVSSGEGDNAVHRHRLDLGGNRAVNSVLHIAHVTQARCDPDARAYLQRRMTKQGQTTRMARRAHKRMLANVIIRHMRHDAEHLTTPQPAAA